MKRASKNKTSPWASGRLGLFLLLVFACFMPQNRVGAFSVVPAPGVGVPALESSMFIGENVDESRYDASGYTVAPKTTTQPNRIYSARELQRRADSPRINNAPNPNHNFPESFNAEIFKGNRTVVSDDYILYTKPGNLNGRSGVYEIGVRPSTSGRTEVITHRFFNPDKN